jgi:hypothetical protein
MSDNALYTEEEVVYFIETLMKFYKYEPETKTWNMQTHMAPGMLHETTAQLLQRLINTEKEWQERRRLKRFDN